MCNHVSVTEYKTINFVHMHFGFTGEVKICSGNMVLVSYMVYDIFYFVKMLQENHILNLVAGKYSFIDFCHN